MNNATAEIGGSLRDITPTLARLMDDSTFVNDGPLSTSLAHVAAILPEVTLEHVRSAISARRLRARFFDDNLFSDPAWDMLLDLFQAEIAQVKISTSSLCIAAAVPSTTALRWMKKLSEAELIVRHSDPTDGRRVFIELAPATSESMRRYFTKLDNLVGI